MDTNCIHGRVLSKSLLTKKKGSSHSVKNISMIPKTFGKIMSGLTRQKFLEGFLISPFLSIRRSSCHQSNKVVVV